MIRLAEHKELTEHKTVQKVGLPNRVYIPLAQHFGKPCDNILVKPNDSVKTGEFLATSQGGVFSPVHSSVSGKVVSIADYAHPVLGRSKAVVIESDGKDEKAYEQTKKEDEIEAISKEQIKEIIFNAGIVGLGGAGFPAHIKLSPPKTIGTFILNGAECEPYLTTDYRLMLERTDEIILGIKIILKILQPKEIFIAIEDNKKDAIEKFQSNSLPSNWRVKILKTSYPQGGEKQVVESCLGKQVPSGKLPFDIGVVVSNAATVYAIYEAVYKNKPLYERAITIAGSCVENPGNFQVRIGTTVKDLLSLCVTLKEEPAKVIFGGPMMGIAQYTLDVPIIKTTSGIIFFSKDEIIKKESRVCCRCARCIDVCPVNIMPAMISMAAEKERWDIAKEYDVFDCIECGLCSYICPAKRDLIHLIKYAKARVKK